MSEAHDGPGLSPQEEDIRLLQNMFAEVDRYTIELTYKQCDRDMSETMKALAALVKVPRPTVTPYEEADDSPHMTADASGDVFHNTGEVHSPNNNGGREGSGSFSGAAWDMSALSEGLSTVGATVSQGMTTLAASLSSWVTDITSAFDTGWSADDEVDGEHSSEAQRPLPTSVAVASSVDKSDRPRSRRLQVGSPRIEREESRTSAHGQDFGDEEDECDAKKDS